MDTLSNLRFSRLTVLERYFPGVKSEILWKCLCDCGAIFIARGSNLKKGIAKSCGCLRKELMTKHGYYGTVTYTCWLSIKSRCLNKKHPSYHNYGGRGISICDRWLLFDNFLYDMGECPEGLSIDRINHDGNYEPTNCRWATPKEQNNNKRTNLYITYNGEVKTLTQWAEFFKIKPDNIQHRLLKGWSFEKAVTTPVRQKRSKSA